MQGGGEGQIGIRVVVLGVNAARKAAYDAQHAFDQVNKSLGASAIAAEAFDRKLARLGASVSTLGRNLSFSLTVPLTVLNTALIGAGISFEDAFAGVGKTVEGVTTGFKEVAEEMYGTSKGLSQIQKDAVFTSGQLGKFTDIGEELRNGFRQLSLEIPISVNELSRIGQVAGQLGVRAGEIEDFTRTIALLTVSTDLAAEEAAFALARIGNIMGVATEDLDTFARQAGAAIVALGNNAAATEPEIVNLAMRMAAAGRLVGLTTPEILGLSATLAELGVRAERGGTAVSRVIYEMLEAASGANEETAEMFANILNIDISTFKSRFRADAIGTIKDFLNVLVDLQDQGKISGDVLTALGLSGVRVREVVNLLGPNMQLLSDNIGLANEQWTEQIALEEEAAKRFATVKSQLILLKNAFVDLGISIFDAVAPDIQKVIKVINGAIASFSTLDETTKRWIARISLAVAAIGPLLIVFGSLIQLVANSVGGFRILGTVMAAALTLPSLTPQLKKLRVDTTSVFGRISGVFKNLFGGLVGAVVNPLKDAFTTVKLLFETTILSPVQKGISTVSRVVKAGLLFIPNLIGKAFGGLLNTAKFLFNFLPAPIRLISALLKTVLGPAVAFITGLFKVLGQTAFSVFGGVAKEVIRLPKIILSFLPGLAKGLFSGLLGIVSRIPLILAGIGVAFTLLFAPKVISQAVKNWEGVLSSMKTAFSTFVDDLRNEGLERALLLLTSGGSLGSGRESGILGIAKALGASEEHAKNFSYALGTATYWVIQIAKSVGTLVRRIVEVVSGGESINNAFGSTSERIISLVTVISEFLEGFFEGWTSGFDGIISAVESLMPTISNTLSEIGRLFDTVFGKGEEDVNDFYKTLEPGTDSGISRAGEKLGEIVATLLEYAVRGFTLVVDVVGRITGAIADLVKAYNEGGIEGLLTELGNKLSGVWDFLLAGATLLWEDKIKPALSTAIEKTSSWLKTTGKDLLIDAATVLWGAFASVVDSILFGKAVTIQRPVEKTVTSMLSYTAKEGDNLLDIARKHNTSVNKIRAANNRLFEDYYVWPGESIMIPMEETVSTVEPETLQFPGILGAIKSLIENISTYLSSEETKNTIKNAFNDALSKIGELLSYLWEGSGDWKGLRTYFDTFLTDVRNWFNTNAHVFKAIGKDIASAIKSGVADALTPDWLVEFILPAKDIKTTSGLGSADAALMASVMAEATNFGPLLSKALAGTKLNQSEIDGILQGIRNLGQDIPESLEEGLRNGSLTQEDRVYLIGVQIANTLTRGTKDGVGANSPSTVFRQIGSDVIAGLAIGISYNLPNLNSVVSAMVNIFFQAANQITNAMNNIRMQVFQIQGYMQTVQKAQITTQLAYQQAQQQAAVAAAQQAAQVAGQIGGALTGFNPMFPPVNQIILNTQPARTTTTTTNVNTNVTGIPITNVDDAAYVIDRTLRTVKAGHMITR